MSRRRDLLMAAPGVALFAAAGQWPKPALAQPAGDWGGPQGYPTGWGPPGQPQRWEGYPAYRAGNYSGGFEAMFRHHLIAAPAQASPLQVTPIAINYRWGLVRRGVPDYLNQWPVTGLLIARQGRVWAEHYRFGRDAGAWLDDCARHGPQDAPVRYGTMRADMGYKSFFWHPRPNGAWLMMNGHHGQRVLIDRASQTVLVQTALSHEGPWQRELFTLFEAAIDSQG